MVINKCKEIMPFHKSADQIYFLRSQKWAISFLHGTFLLLIYMHSTPELLIQLAVTVAVPGFIQTDCNKQSAHIQRKKAISDTVSKQQSDVRDEGR